MTNTVFIKIQTVPLLQKVKDCHRVGESHLEICPYSLPQMFQFTNLRKRFDQHSVVPLAAIAKFQIIRLIIFRAKSFVGKDDHFLINGFDHRQKLPVGNIGSFDLPIGYQTEFVSQNTKFAADDPFPRSKALFANSFSVWLINLTDRMTQFDAVRIDDTEDCRLGKKLFGQLPMSFQTAKKPDSLRQIRKQFKPIMFEPTIEGTLGNTFESKQQSKRDKFALRSCLKTQNKR